MNFNDMFNQNFLSKDDVGTGCDATITAIRMDEVGSGRDAEVKPVMEFEEFPGKLFTLNKVNAKAISDAFGDTKNWLGKKISLYVDSSIMYQGKRVGGIRVRVRAELVKQPDADTPF